MNKLVCDDCGSINGPGRTTCELCGESLREEAARENTKSIVFLVPFALVSTAAIVGLPGLVLGHLIYAAGGATSAAGSIVSDPFGVPPISFWGIYLGGWLILLLISYTHEPRSDHELGGVYSLMSDGGYQPRHMGDRIHFAEGCLLTPVIFLRSIWSELFSRMAGDA